MVFWFSKVFSFLYSPLSWLIISLLLSLIIRNKKCKKRFSRATLIIALFFTNSFIADEAVRLLESKEKTIKTGVVYDAGIVLGGGMITYDAQTGQSTFRNNTDRIMQAIYLYKYGRIKKILISSGSGSLIHRNVLEACLLRDYFINIGFDENDIIAECESDNTYENAVKSAKILKEHFPDGKFLLITSTTHIRRAKACFKKQGIQVDVYPTNPITGYRRWDLQQLLVPDISAIEKWQLVIKETIGLISYKLFGYI